MRGRSPAPRTLPSDHRISSSGRFAQVKIGVSRWVYRLASLWRSRMTSVTDSLGSFPSNDTTKSWPSRPKE